MIAFQLSDERLASGCEGHQRRPPVGGVRLTRYKVIGDEGINEAGHCARSHFQRLRQDTLRHGTTPTQLPEQVGAGRCEPKGPDRLRHVVVQHDHELEDAIEQILVLL